MHIDNYNHVRAMNEKALSKVNSLPNLSEFTE